MAAVLVRRPAPEPPCPRAQRPALRQSQHPVAAHPLGIELVGIDPTPDRRSRSASDAAARTQLIGDVVRDGDDALAAQERVGPAADAMAVSCTVVTSGRARRVPRAAGSPPALGAWAWIRSTPCCWIARAKPTGIAPARRVCPRRRGASADGWRRLQRARARAVRRPTRPGNASLGRAGDARCRACCGRSRPARGAAAAAARRLGGGAVTRRQQAANPRLRRCDRRSTLACMRRAPEQPGNLVKLTQ